jgi:hypothetical protein
VGKQKGWGIDDDPFILKTRAIGVRDRMSLGGGAAAGELQYTCGVRGKVL